MCGDILNEKDCKMASVRLSIPVQIKREKTHFAEGEKNPVAQTHNPEEEKQHPARVPGNPRHCMEDIEAVISQPQKSPAFRDIFKETS